MMFIRPYRFSTTDDRRWKSTATQAWSVRRLLDRLTTAYIRCNPLLRSLLIVIGLSGFIWVVQNATIIPWAVIAIVTLVVAVVGSGLWRRCDPQPNDPFPRVNYGVFLLVGALGLVATFWVVSAIYRSRPSYAHYSTSSLSPLGDLLVFLVIGAIPFFFLVFLPLGIAAEWNIKQKAERDAAIDAHNNAIRDRRAELDQRLARIAQEEDERQSRIADLEREVRALEDRLRVRR